MYRSAVQLLLFSLLLTFFLFLPLSTRLQTHLINAGDPLFYAWNLSHNLDALEKGFEAVVNTNIFYPRLNTLAFSDTLFAQSLIVAPVYYLTHNAILAENIAIFMTFPLSALSMFFLTFYLTRSKSASFLSGIFFAFCYPRLAQLSHLPSLSTQWLPLNILFTLRYLQKGKSSDLFFLLFFFLLTLASSMYNAVFVTVFSGFLFILFVLSWIFRFQIKKEGSLQRFSCKKALLSGVLLLIALVFVLILVLPYIRLKIDYPEITRTLDETGKYSLQLQDTIAVLPTSFLHRMGLPTNTGSRVFYPTVTLLFLSVIALATKNRTQRYTIYLFFLLGGLAWLLSFGPSFYSLNLPYYYLYKVFPLLHIIRVPARFGIFFSLSLSVLAGFGLVTLEKTLPKNVIRFLFTGILLLFLTEIWQINTPSVAVRVSPMPDVYRWLRDQNDSMRIVELPLTPMYWGNSIEEQITKEYKDLTVDDMVASETYRVYFSSYHKKQMMNGYSGYFPQSYYDAAYRLASFPSPDSLELIRSEKINYIIIHLWQYSSENQRTLTTFIRNEPSLHFVGQFGSDWVYTLEES